MANSLYSVQCVQAFAHSFLVKISDDASITQENVPVADNHYDVQGVQAFAQIF
jgi:hypothetical protein